MNKSIYEEALEIIIIHGTALTESSKTNKLKIIKALEKAQKQEELLELYKRLINDWDDLSYKEVYDLEKQIKELENE